MHYSFVVKFVCVRRVFMKRQLNIAVLLFIFIAYLLVGCSEGNKTYRYIGESKNWKGSYTLDYDSNANKEDGEGFLIYKGKDLNEVDRVQYEVKRTNGNTRGTGQLTEGKIFLGDGCKGCDNYDRKTPINVTIKWNGQRETFDMEYKKPGS
jgi:hypothetical protein